MIELSAIGEHEVFCDYGICMYSQTFTFGEHDDFCYADLIELMESEGWQCSEDGDEHHCPECVKKMRPSVKFIMTIFCIGLIITLYIAMVFILIR